MRERAVKIRLWRFGGVFCFVLLSNKCQNCFETHVLVSTKWNSCNNKTKFQPGSIHDVNIEITVTTWRLIYETTIIVSAQTPVLDRLFNSVFGLTSKKTWNLVLLAICNGIPAVGFRSQRDSNAEIVFMSWRHHAWQTRQKTKESEQYTLQYCLRTICSYTKSISRVIFISYGSNHTYNIQALFLMTVSTNITPWAMPVDQTHRFD